LADDSILAIRNETVRAAENSSNIEMRQITGCSNNNNKINFNEGNSRVKILSRMKRKESKKINIY